MKAFAYHVSRTNNQIPESFAGNPVRSTNNQISRSLQMRSMHNSLDSLDTVPTLLPNGLVVTLTALTRCFPPAATPLRTKLGQEGPRLAIWCRTRTSRVIRTFHTEILQLISLIHRIKTGLRISDAPRQATHGSVIQIQFKISFTRFCNSIWTLAVQPV